VIAGPHMENFAEIAELFTREGALIRIENARDLSQEIRRWLDDPDARERTGRRAKELAASQRGATQLAVAAAAEWLEESWLQPLHTVGARILLTPFVWLWRWGARRDQAKQLRGSKKLMRPVVCVGGMTMGGSGKTPMVLHLASHFRAMGKMPAILTRGYKRLSPEKYTVLPAGGRAPVSLTGDEAQIFVRSAIAHLGIGGDRVKVGEELLRQLPADLILLDDGYQHRRLQRDFDLLLLDAQNPVSAGQLFPLGRLREPVSGIGRADAIVLTRTQRGREYRQLLLRLRQWNPRAPIPVAGKARGMGRVPCWHCPGVGTWAREGGRILRVGSACSILGGASKDGNQDLLSMELRGSSSIPAVGSEKVAEPCSRGRGRGAVDHRKGRHESSG
jgi:3-deoxy-D-manno-octulosonic-acid transferase